MVGRKKQKAKLDLAEDDGRRGAILPACEICGCRATSLGLGSENSSESGDSVMGPLCTAAGREAGRSSTVECLAS